jgi:glutamine cyclotransferase
MLGKGTFQILQAVPEILNEYQRHPNELVWTEGLQWCNGFLYESAGLSDNTSTNPFDPSESQLSQLKLEDQNVTTLARFLLPSSYYAEDITIVGNQLFQIIEGTTDVFVYELEPFKHLPGLSSKSPIDQERWGVCIDPINELFYLSHNGSNVLDIYLKQNLGSGKPQSTLTVKLHDNSVYGLNTLEFANGFIYAAIMDGTDSHLIVQIDPADGNVTAQIEANNLWKAQGNPKALDLNGIAYCRTDTDGRDVFFVTGKYWAKIFEVKF